jgi:hypothetical protein
VIPSKSSPPRLASPTSSPPTLPVQQQQQQSLAAPLSLPESVTSLEDKSVYNMGNLLTGR